jgi:hypothetical protein
MIDHVTSMFIILFVSFIIPVLVAQNALQDDEYNILNLDTITLTTERNVKSSTGNVISQLFGMEHLNTIQRAIQNHGINAMRKNTTDISYRFLQQQEASASLSVSTNNSTDGSDKPNFDLQAMCSIIEQSFVTYNVTCKCAGNVIDNFSITCDYNEIICNNSTSSSSTQKTTTCGVPQIAIAMVNQKVFSSTTCMKQYTRNNISLEDTCVFVDSCAASITTTSRRTSSTGQPNDDSGIDELRPKFCDCTASYGGSICDTCQICSNGNAIAIDCRNINAQAITTNDQCTNIDLDLQFGSSTDGTNNNSNNIAGFVPEFTGFCTELENTMNNTISCDCTNAIGGSYNISCMTNDRVCVHDDTIHCGTVHSTVNVVDGIIDTVTSCATYDTQPFTKNSKDGDVTCTTIQFCTDTGNETTSSSMEINVCSCSATYDNEKCNSCTIVHDGSTLNPPLLSDTNTAYITIDCSNINPDAITESYQPIRPSSNYEFLPYYERIKTNDLSFGPQSSSTGNNNRSIHRTTVIVAVALLFGLFQ